MTPFARADVELIWGYISRTLGRLVALVKTLPAEILDWRPPAPETNSIMALAAHTVANAYENLAGTLCGEPMARDHRAEFAATTATRREMLVRWRRECEEIADRLSHLPPEILHAPVEHPRRGRVTGLDVLLVVARHTAEHLGQAELTRDLAIAALRGS